MARPGHRIPDTLPRKARRAVALTHLALWWEALARAFWPAASLAVAGLAALALGAGRAPLIGPALGPVLVLAVLLLAGLGWRRLRPPAPGAALARVDARLPGQPLTALGDRMAVGAGDAGSRALWAAHQARALDAAGLARASVPRAGLAARDPFALRLAAVTALAMALIFGDVAGLGQGWGALASGTAPHRLPPGAPAADSWEGWAEPPAHTGCPVVYLNALPESETLTLPQGSRVTLRLYGSTQFAQSIGPQEAGLPADAPAFAALKDGSIDLPGGRRIGVTVTPDAAPTVAAGPAPERRADGRLVQRFTAADDYGVTAGKAEIALDLAAVPRRYGLARAPEPRPALSLDLPLPARGRDALRGALTADLARHPYANLPVVLTLRVEDGLGQVGESTPLHMVLPGRRFFDPRASALIELRQSLLWSRENRAEVAQVLRAILWPQGELFEAELDQGLRALVARLESGPLDARTRDEAAEALWQSAIALEDGGLSDAIERMQRAQERLSEAIRQGASPDEIARLMRELREATDAYTRMLAERGEAPEARFTRDRPMEELSGDQIQAMMDEIERLMREGRTAEAQELLEQFNRMMKNLEVRQGQSSGGAGNGEGQDQAMDQLTETLRDQQRLADEAMRRQRDERGMWRPETPGEADDLAQAQRELREQLGRQRGLLPGQGSAPGDEAARELDEAGRAMEEAEEALRRGGIGEAMDRQAEAIRRLREGMRRLSQLGQEGAGAPQTGEGEAGGLDEQGRDGSGAGGDGTRRDPLGRSTDGTGGSITTDSPLGEFGPGEAMRRARDLLDEIRRRSGQLQRPQDERDYLRRLLERF